MADLHPLIAAQFVENLKHPGFGPGKLKPGSGDLCAWKCDKGHVRNQTVRTRAVLGIGCDPCRIERQRIARPGESLKDLHPVIADQFVENVTESEFGPDRLKPGSNDWCVWRCDFGHEWSAMVNARIAGGKGCERCRAEKWRTADPGDSLAELHPWISQQFVKNLTHPGFGPERLRPSSTDRCIWKCPVGHEWETVVGKRTAGRGCHACAKSRKGGRESRLEYEVGELVEAATGLAYELHIPVTGGGETREVDLLFRGVNLAVDLDPHHWHRDSLRDERKQRVILQSEFDVLRIRNPEVKAVLGESIEVAGKNPWDWARALSAELKSRGVEWKHLTRTEVSSALGKAFTAWAEAGAALPNPSAVDVAPHLAVEFVANLTRQGVGLEWLRPGAHDTCLWRCVKRGHEWEATVSSRAGKRRTGCRKCYSESRRKTPYD